MGGLRIVGVDVVREKNEVLDVSKSYHHILMSIGIYKDIWRVDECRYLAFH